MHWLRYFRPVFYETQCEWCPPLVEYAINQPVVDLASIVKRLACLSVSVMRRSGQVCLSVCLSVPLGVYSRRFTMAQRMDWRFCPSTEILAEFISIRLKLRSFHLASCCIIYQPVVSCKFGIKSESNNKELMDRNAWKETNCQSPRITSEGLSILDTLG